MNSETTVIVPLTDSTSRIDRGTSSESTGACDPANRFLANHFPGCPVVPGIVMLDWGIEAAFMTLEGHRLSHSERHRLVSVTGFKFRRFLRPGEMITVKSKVESRDGNFVEFRTRVMREKRAVANGTLVVRVDPVGAELDNTEPTASFTASPADLLDLSEWKWFEDFRTIRSGHEAEAVLRLTRVPRPKGMKPDEEGGIHAKLGAKASCPPALILEGLAQAGVELIRPGCPDGSCTALGEIESLAMTGDVHIGDTVRLAVKVVEPRSEFHDPGQHYTRVLGRASVNGDVVLDTEFSLIYAQPAAAD